MARRTPRPNPRVPAGTRSKTVVVNKRDLIEHTLPLFKQFGENLLRYGLTKEDLYDEVDGFRG